MENYKKITEAIVRWLRPRAIDLLKKQAPVATINDYLRNSNSLKGFINFFGIDLMKYNVVDELNFLIEPAIKQVAGKHIIEGLKKLGTDEEIVGVVNEICDSAISEAARRSDNTINVFGVKLNLKDLESLKLTINETN